MPVLDAYNKQQDEGGLSKGEAVQQVAVLVLGHGRLTNGERCSGHLENDKRQTTLSSLGTFAC